MTATQSVRGGSPARDSKTHGIKLFFNDEYAMQNAFISKIKYVVNISAG